MENSSQAKGIGLHFGVSQIDIGSNGYPNTDQFTEMASIAKDTIFYQGICEERGFQYNRKFLNEEATRTVFRDRMEDAANQLESGDFLALTFSGHGTQLTSRNPKGRYNTDEGWCFYDGIIIDNQLCEYLSWFKSGVRILVVSDSCYSGDMLRDWEMAKWNVKHIGEGCQNGTGVKAAVILLASSDDEKVSMSGPYYSRFTTAFAYHWDRSYKSRKKTGYGNFFMDIASDVHSQHPRIQLLGQGLEAFVDEAPFHL